MAAPNQPITLNVQWMQDPTAVPLPVNQVAIVGGPNVENETLPDTYILALGHVTPPMVAADASPEFLAAVQAQGILVAPVGRFSMTPARLAQLRDLLDQVLRDRGAAS